jgi:hypothetical protein
MYMVPVESSNLVAVGYDPLRPTMHVQFWDESVYGYYGVPPSVHEGLMTAWSKGTYLHRMVRGVYQYQRVQ